MSEQFTAQASQFIDTVQGAKTSFVQTFVKNADIAKSLNAFIDAQTKFSKQVVKTAAEVANLSTQELVKFDASKAFAFAK
jgi:hypothetical protein